MNLHRDQRGAIRSTVVCVFVALATQALAVDHFDCVPDEDQSGACPKKTGCPTPAGNSYYCSSKNQLADCYLGTHICQELGPNLTCGYSKRCLDDSYTGTHQIGVDSNGNPILEPDSCVETIPHSCQQYDDPAV